MKRVSLLVVFFSLVIHSATFAGDDGSRPVQWATPLDAPSMQNFYKIDDRLYRSAQPQAAGMQTLARLGVRNVLNLREFHTDDKEAAGTGLKLYHVPMNAGWIEDEDVAAALTVIKSAQGPILVHCWHGSDRTGVIVAMYRIIFQQWPKAAAIDELVNGGYGYHSIYDNIVTYIENVKIEEIKKYVVASGKLKEPAP